MAQNDHPSFFKLLQLPKFNPPTDISRNGGRRVIDFIFTSIPILRQVDPTEHCHNLPNVSDHIPLLLSMQAQDPAQPTIVPNKHFDFIACQKLVERYENCGDYPDIEDLMKQTKTTTIQQNVKPLVKIKTKAHPTSDPNQRLLDIINKPNFMDIINKNLEKFAKSIICNRFTPAARVAFKNMRKLTKYSNYEKRDGSIMTEAKHNGSIIHSQELER